jgi:hypothetical protein
VGEEISDVLHPLVCVYIYKGAERADAQLSVTK